MLKKTAAILLASTIICSPVFAAPSSWAKSEVAEAAGKGLVSEKITADYQKPITRGEFCEEAMLLFSRLGGTEKPTDSVAFSDTDDINIKKAAALGIVFGVGDGLFAPEQTITRQEICTMLSRLAEALGKKTDGSDFVNTFADGTEISDWAQNSVKYINMLEVMLGDKNGNIMPQSNTTCEQAILLINRLYKTLAATSAGSFLSMYGLVSSGNTSSNMKNGAFAVKGLDGVLYISDGRGIYSSDENSSLKTVLSSSAKNIFVDSDIIYYINSADGKIRSVSKNGSNDSAVSQNAAEAFTISGNNLYYKDSSSKLIRIDMANGEESEIVSHITSVPVAASFGVYYADESGIYSKNISTGAAECILSGSYSLVISDNGVFYALNSEGKLCSLSTNGEERVITDKPVSDFVICTDIAVFKTSDGIYKADLKGSFEIKLTDDTSAELNSYARNIYLKTTDGRIYLLNTKTLEKIRLNQLTNE